MIRKLLILVILLLSAFMALGQRKPDPLYKAAQNSPDTNQVNVALQTGRKFLRPAAPRKNELDSALKYIQTALTMSTAIHATEHQYRALALKAEHSFKMHDYPKADQTFTEVAGYYHQSGAQLKEAAIWDRYADIIPYNAAPLLETRLKCVTNAYNIYKSRNDRLKTSQALGRIADVDLNMRNYDKAERELLAVIAESKALNYRKQYYAYYLLAETYYRKNEVQKHLLARIECVNSYEGDPKHTIDDGLLYYYCLARAYLKNKLYERAIQYYEKCMGICVQLNDRQSYYQCVAGIVNCYTDLKSFNTGLTALRKYSKGYRPQNRAEESLLLFAELKLYNLLNQLRNAEKIIPAFTKVYNELYQNIRKDSNFYGLDNFVEHYDPLLKYHIQTRQWDELAEELKKIEALPQEKMLVVTKLTIYTDRFKLDSARGDMLAALRGFQRIKLISDSLTNQANSQQINELEAKYASVRKDKTIQNLNSQSVIQKSKLEKINLQRNLTFAGILIAITLAGLLYFAYRDKQKANLQLQDKQAKINDQNIILSALVKEKETLLLDKDNLLNEQEELLTEKEWLLKEIHHRVKNNLQIVMSLLYTQGAYLQNTDAKEAIRDSQNRVQVISIIHQKLYSESNVSFIVVADYVSDLVRHLGKAYDCNRRKISFGELLDPVKLDISQAVPMGLILNEAITNCIKYAFDDEGGEILIDGRSIPDDSFLLTIADNGKGLPAGFSMAESTSLGMEMMRALSKQLGGTIRIEDHSGVTVILRFKIFHSIRP